MKLLTKIGLIVSTGMLFFSSVFATSVQQSSVQPMMLQANKVIPNLAAGLQAVKIKTNLPIIFPKSIPVPSASKKYYLSVFSDSNNNQYILNIDATPTCNGIKYCNIGSIIVRVNGKVGIQAAGGSKLTQTVQLANGQQAYYTPAHAEADYWPTMLQWKTGKLAYYLSWTITQKNWDQKNIIIELANSALQAK